MEINHEADLHTEKTMPTKGSNGASPTAEEDGTEPRELKAFALFSHDRHMKTLELVGVIRAESVAIAAQKIEARLLDGDERRFHVKFARESGESSIGARDDCFLCVLRSKQTLVRILGLQGQRRENILTKCGSGQVELYLTQVPLI